MSRTFLAAAGLVLLAAACGGPAATAPRTTTPGPVVPVTPSQQASPPMRSSLGSSPASTSLPTPPATAGPTAAASPPTGIQLIAEPFASGLPALTFLTNAGDGTGMLFAAGQEGVITALTASGEIQTEPFLDISDRITAGGERGLLGLAFHPDYESNGRFFVNYTDLGGDSVTAEFARSDTGSGRALGDAQSERILLTIDDPFANHNGGMLAFGPDGYLYLSMGDGGSGGDPEGNGQSLATLLGKMIRIDVDSGEPYGIPPDNPFANSDRPEIWSYGLRNPWRFSFDRETGDMFIGDVGQTRQEEIDAEPAGEGGRNYGWDVMEGDECFGSGSCDQTGLTLPVAVNDRERRECAIIGGYVYRGTQFPDLQGTYVYSDACSAEIWILDARTAIEQGRAETFVVGRANVGPSSFGEDEAGELYLVDLRGAVYRIVLATT